MIHPPFHPDARLDDDDLLDLDAWETPDRLSADDCLIETGCDALRGRRPPEEDER